MHSSCCSPGAPSGHSRSVGRMRPANLIARRRPTVHLEVAVKRRAIPAIWGRLASVDASDERDRLAARPLAQERSRLFDQQAEAYDRFRPTYPDAVIDELLGPVPAGLDVLDVGCGTGIASRQIAQRGAKVLGVELAPRMAEIARGHGIEVEIAAFEGWDAAGRHASTTGFSRRPPALGRPVPSPGPRPPRPQRRHQPLRRRPSEGPLVGDALAGGWVGSRRSGHQDPS